MDLLFLPLTLMIYVDQGGSKVVPRELMTYEDCADWKKRAEERPAVRVDPLSGRSLVAVAYNCTPVQPGEIVEQISRLQPSQG